MIRGIPERAYEYVVNGRSTIEWIMESYQVKTDKSNGHVYNPNTYSEDPKYIPSLLISFTALSLKMLDLRDQMSEYKEL